MPGAILSCYTRREDRTTLLALEGTLDIATSPEAIRSMERFLAEHGPDLILDTSRLDFIDSKGVGALLSGAKAARDAGGKLFLHDPALPVRKILDMCGLMALFPPRPPAPPAVAAPPAEPAAARKPAAARPRRTAG